MVGEKGPGRAGVWSCISKGGETKNESNKLDVVTLEIPTRITINNKWQGTDTNHSTVSKAQPQEFVMIFVNINRQGSGDDATWHRIPWKALKRRRNRGHSIWGLSSVNRGVLFEPSIIWMCTHCGCMENIFFALTYNRIHFKASSSLSLYSSSLFGPFISALGII